MKTLKRVIRLSLLCQAILLTASTCEVVNSWEEGCYSEKSHPNVRFINDSASDVWVEWNPRYPMEWTDSLFSGFQVQVIDSLNLMPLKSICWEGEFISVPFIRLFIFDEAYNSSIRDSASLSQHQDEHLVFKHWYTKEELNELNWTIHYPPLKTER